MLPQWYTAAGRGRAEKIHNSWSRGLELTTELPGVHALQFQELAVEVGQVVEPRVEGDVRNRPIRLDQLPAREPRAQLVQVGHQRPARAAAEEAAERRNAQVGRGRRLGQADPPRAPLVQEPAHAV